MSKNRMQKLLLLVSFLSGLVFYAPVSLLVRTQMGLTVAQVFWLQAILSLSCLIFEVPAGFFSDRFGYKNTWALSQGLLSAARLLLLTARSFPAFALEAVVEGLSYSLLSGTSSAYLYSWCQGEEYALLSSKAGRMGTLGFLASTVLYAVLLPLVGVTGLVGVTCIPTFLSFLILFAMPREQIRENREAQTAVHLPKGAPVLFLILSAYSVAGLVMNFFYAVKVERTGLPYEAMTAIILGYSTVELLAPRIIGRLRESQYRNACLLCLALVGICFGGIFLLDNLAAIGLMVFLPLPLNIFSCLIDELVNARIDAWGMADNRATVLSLLNMGNNVLEILFLTGSALLAGNEGNITFFFAAVYMMVAFVTMCLLKKIQ